MIINFLLLIVGWFTILSLYRLLFHPLSEYSGPNLAAMTSYYETYLDCLRGGMFSKRIDELHKQYGTSAQTLSHPRINN